MNGKLIDPVLWSRPSASYLLKIARTEKRKKKEEEEKKKKKPVKLHLARSENFRRPKVQLNNSSLEKVDIFAMKGHENWKNSAT